MQLTELVKQAEQAGQELWPKLEEIINSYDFAKQQQCQIWMRNDLYVRNLGGLCKVLSAKNVCEIGTMWGDSAIGLSLGAEKVDSYDIDITNFVNEQIALDRNINLIKLADEHDFLNIPFNNYDLVYCDIGTHSGVEELAFHNKLVEDGYVGLVAYDDIEWDSMKQFWNDLPNDKIETNWHSSGFGLVEYVR